MISDMSNTTGDTSGAGPTVPEHLSSPIVFKGIRIVQSLVFNVVFMAN